MRQTGVELRCPRQTLRSAMWFAPTATSWRSTLDDPLIGLETLVLNTWLENSPRLRQAYHTNASSRAPRVGAAGNCREIFTSSPRRDGAVFFPMYLSCREATLAGRIARRPPMDRGPAETVPHG